MTIIQFDNLHQIRNVDFLSTNQRPRTDQGEQKQKEQDALQRQQFTVGTADRKDPRAQGAVTGRATQD